MFVIHRLNSWSDKTSKIRTHLFIKNEILFGEEKSCDIRQDELQGISHRLDFLSHELHDLHNEVVHKLRDQELFQIGSTVYMLAQPPRFRMPIKYSLALGLIVIAIMAFSFGPQPKTVVCSPMERMIASGRWKYEGKDDSIKAYFEDLVRGRKLFKSALQRGDLLTASVELQDLKTKIHQNESCATQAALEDLERKLTEKRILNLIKTNQNILAAELVGQNRGFDLLEERIVKKAKHMLWEAWKIENKDPERSFELKKQIREICEKLGRPQSCLETGLEAPTQSALSD